MSFCGLNRQANYSQFILELYDIFGVTGCTLAKLFMLEK